MIGSGAPAQTPGELLMQGACADLLRAAIKPGTSLEQLKTFAGTDRELSLRLLSIVNIAAFSGASHVADVGAAVDLLGAAGLRNICLALAIGGALPKHEETSALFANCLRRALAARAIAKAVGYESLNDAFMGGLLLEAGTAAQAVQDFTLAKSVARLPAHDRVLFERSQTSSDHVARGVELANMLGVEATIVEAVRSHHAPAMPTPPLAGVLWAAELRYSKRCHCWSPRAAVCYRRQGAVRGEAHRPNRVCAAAAELDS